MKKNQPNIGRLWFYSIACLLFSMSVTTVYARKALPEVEISGVKNLKQMVGQIEAATDYRFSWQGNLIDNVEVTVPDGIYAINALLDKALAGKGISYSIRRQDIVLIRTSDTGPDGSPVRQGETPRKLSGVVVDAVSGEPVAGVAIWLKNTTIGTNSNATGEFSLDVTGNNDVLSASFFGYDPQELTVRPGERVVIKMTSSVEVMDEVVVVGYGVQKKVSVVGAISTVRVGNLKAPVAKISNNLAGQLAGVVSVQRSGEPGAGSTFWIRGINTFGASKNPLVLVDGIERDMDIVNVDDIKEMSILKDASATAIYGVRGANGVVMITTRDGEAGKPRVSFSIEAGMVSPTKVPEMLDAVQFARMYNEAAGSDFYTPEAIAKYADGSDPDLYPNVDWLGELYKNFSWSEKVNVSVSGGSDIARYYVSGSIYNEDGLFAVDNMKNYDTSLYYRRYNFRSNTDVQVFRHTTLNINLGTSFERKNEPGGDTGNVWRYALETAPQAFPLFYSDGTLAGPGNNHPNPYNELTQRGYREKFWNTATATVNLMQDFSQWTTPGLTANIKAAFDAQNHQELARTKQPTQYMTTGRDGYGNLIFGDPTVVGDETLSYNEKARGSRSFYLEAAVNYGRTFDRHTVGALLLYQQQQRNYTETHPSSSSGRGKNPSEFALPYRHQGVAGRLTYNFDDRYFIEGNFGYNGSENFSPGNRFGFFPAGAVGWLLSEEKFFQPLLRVMDMVKFKASYGIVGNDQISPERRFVYLETINQNGGAYQFGDNMSFTGISFGDWPNNSVGWEKACKFNVGAEISMFGRLRLQVDYFSERREGIFLESKSTPGLAGLTNAPWINVGKMKNHGVDAALEYNRQIGQVHLTARGNFTYAHNTILDNDQPAMKYPYMNEAGQSMWQKFGLVADGLFASEEEIAGWPVQTYGAVRPGDIKYIDINNDGQIDEYDTKPLGFPDVPEITYGFGASMRWKGLDFSIFFQGVGNVNFFANNIYTRPFTGLNPNQSNVFSDLAGNYWTPENLDARYPRLSTGVVNNNSQQSSFWMVDGSYVRLKNAEIGYTLPRSWVSAAGMDGLRIYLSGMNLLTFSKFKLWDPDLQTGAANYPNNKVYNIGATISF
jgi:TonB-linked SusC/RagA family outer membrane protein